MKLKECIELIGIRISAQFPDFQFNKREERLYKTTQTGWQAITIDVLKTRAQDMGKLAAYAHVRHDSLEALYTPYVPNLKPKDAKKHSTVIAYCDNLLKNKELIHGFRLDPISIGIFADRYAAALKEDVFPWLDRFTDEQTLFESLLGSDYKTWILNPRNRFPVLLAILAKRGDVDQFDKVASEFQDWCKGPQAFVHAPFATATLQMRPKVNHTSQP